MSKITNIQRNNNYTKVEFINSEGLKYDYELFFHPKNNSAGLLKNNEDIAGLFFDNKKRLIDYDMCYSLSKSAIKTIRLAGFIVPRIFEKI